MSYAIEKHYTETATISRMTDILGTDKQALEDIFIDIPIHLQPLQDSFSEDIDGGYGKDFLMFTKSREIKQGDRAIINGNEYRVMSVERYEFLDRAKHMECRVRLFKNI